MRAYVFGNGASIACGQHTGSDFLAWGLAEAMVASDSSGVISNVRRNLRSGLGKLLKRLDDVGSLTTGCAQGHHWPETLGDYRKLIHNQLDTSDKVRAKDNLEQLFSRKNFSAVVEEAVAVASNSEPYTYRDAAQKRAALLGPHSGNFIDSLEDLQRDICGLASYRVVSPNYYDVFVRLLLAEPEALVVNLNWDSLMEQAYRRVTESEPNHVYLPHSLLVRSEAPIGRHFLSKPHGSLEYLCCQSRAHAAVNGCFRLTVLPGAWNYPVHSDEKRRCLHACGYASNLVPFLAPYARVVRSRRASPFVAASLEALKPFFAKVEEIVSIGYSFSTDAAGWIDEDLLPIFDGKRIHLVDQGPSTATEKASDMQTSIGFSQVVPMEVPGFAGYVAESEKAGRLLP